MARAQERGVTPVRRPRVRYIELDRTIKGVGRIRATTYTTDKKLARDYNGMLGALKRGGRLDILEAIRDKRLTVPQVWHYFAVGELEAVPTVEEMRPYLTTAREWVAGYRLGKGGISDRHRQSLRTCLEAVVGGHTGPSLGTLPTNLRAYRQRCATTGHARQFNLTRSAVQAFLRDTMGRDSRLYRLVTGLEALPYTPARQVAGTPVEKARDIKARLGGHWGDMWWSMAITGMGWKEYAVDGWRVEGDRVVIYGVKRKGRTRVVPRLGMPVKPKYGYQAFRRHCVDAGTAPYAARRTFAHWLEEAGVPRTRRKLYLGHKAGDVTDLYERHEVEAYLEADRAKLLAYLEPAGEAGLRLVK